MKTCCTTLEVMSRTPEEYAADPMYDALHAQEWSPVVGWNESIGLYVIGSTAIFHCPWCGSSLPNRSEDVLEQARRTGIVIDHSGPTVVATLAGAPVDPDALMTWLREETRDQD